MSYVAFVAFSRVILNIVVAVWSFLKMEEERRRERFLEYPREKWNDSDYY